MDIFNQPPPIADDTLHYTLHFPASENTSLPAISTLILAFVSDLTPGHIWHRDAFELKLAKADDTAWLEGTMRVGDAVDDEWCTVWLLREISKKWDAVISVVDSDGQFLLIEAADSLPSWVTPSNAENRVWIYQSHLHLVPLSHTSPAHTRSRHRPTRTTAHADSDDDEPGDSAVEGWISTADALSAVRSPNTDTLASAAVESALWARIAAYPALLSQHIHHTLALLPTPIALALHRSPSLVQKATETFYTRDALQLRAARKMARFPPKPDVLVRVGMTRTAYAQVVGQRFGAPKVFGRWEGPGGEEGGKEWRWWDVGMKIACGFEMLYQESKGKSAIGSTPESAEARIDALRRDAEYSTYISNLRSAGFFGTELEGSGKWKEMENRAAEAYVTARRDDDASRPSFASLVETALAPPLPDVSYIAATPNTPEDSDAWLSIDAQDLEGVLAKAANGPRQAEAERHEGKAEEEAAGRLQELAKKVEAFVEGEGDVEGAKFPDDILSDDEVSDEEMDKDMDMDDLPSSASSASDGDDDIEMSDARRQTAMAALVQPLDAGEYGKMPSTYTDPSEPVDMSTPHRRPLLGRDTYEGVDSDDSELEPAGQGLSDEEEEGEDRPMVVDEEEGDGEGEGGDEVDVNMEEEGEEFMRFAREQLGIGEEMWEGIVKEREGRGAFVPTSKAPASKPTFGPPPPTSAPASTSTTAPKPAQPTAPPKKPKGDNAVHFFDEPPKPQNRTPQPGPRPNANPNLDSFEAVMQAMDRELARGREERGKGAGKTKGKGKERAEEEVKPKDKGKGKARATTVEDEEEEDVAAAMDAELRASLKSSRTHADSSGDEDEEGEEEPMDYNLIKNFLESFKSQAGLAGPVSGLAGRLEKGWAWPRDEGEEG